MKRGLLFIIVPLLLLVACSSAPAATPATTVFYDNTLYDEQGAVTVAVTPLKSDGATVEFDVAMNTHSVDLSMDLASLTMLTNDRGQTVTPTGWDAPRSGHHVTGKLTFPNIIVGGSMLEGAKQITLTIRNVNVPERVFEWSLDQGS